jgi:hypothetical protein
MAPEFLGEGIDVVEAAFAEHAPRAEPPTAAR